jgi:tRNA 2-thiouridine synthesizing protein C
MSETKKFMYLNRRAPYGTIYALEGLEVVLIGAAFEQDVSMAFMDDGVFHSQRSVIPVSSDMKISHPPTMLSVIMSQSIYVEQSHDDDRGLTLDDLQLCLGDEDKITQRSLQFRVVSRRDGRSSRRARRHP